MITSSPSEEEDDKFNLTKETTMKKLLLFALLASCFSITAYAAPQDLIDINSITAPVMSCSSITSRAALGNATAQNIEIYNSGSSPIFVVTGGSSVTATFPTSSASTGKIVPGDAVVIYSKSPTDTHIACITAADTITVYVSTGRGE